MQYRSVTVLAPAKLNLSLDVVGTLPNGYHDLDMVMQTIDLYEKITLRRSHDLTLNLPGSFVPANDKNHRCQGRAGLLCLYRTAGRRGYDDLQAGTGAGRHGRRQCRCRRGAGRPERAVRRKAFDE